MHMRHFKDPRFNPLYLALPKSVQIAADKNFALLKSDPRHPSLHFKKIQGELWSARVGLNYRLLALKADDGFQWFWIGTHGEYDRHMRS